MRERRSNERFKSSTILQYKQGLFKGCGDAVTQNLSLGGICFFSEKRLKKGQIIKLKVYYDSKHPAKSLKGKIVWSKESEDKVSKGFINGLVLM